MEIGNVVINNVEQEAKPLHERVRELEALVEKCRVEHPGVDEVRATLIVNYGKERGRNHKICDEDGTTFDMLVQVLKWFHVKLEEAENDG